jgi:hypothetical protein
MSNEITTGNEYNAESGENFYLFMDRVRTDLCKNNFMYGHAIFNDINITVSKNSCIDDLNVIYKLKSQLRQLGKY